MKKSLIAGLVLVFAASCTETETPNPSDQMAGIASVTIDSRYGDADFALNTALTSASGSQELQYEFTRLRYWVSNVTLIAQDGSAFDVPSSYFLIEENNEIQVQDGSYNKVYPAKKRETFELKDIPVGDYKGIRFHIGVDPTYNDNLALQAGELNALNGMASDSWMWFTSYIFTSMSGRMTWVKDAPESKNFFWETGSNEFYGEKEILFDQPITVNSEHSVAINLELDVRKLVELELPWENSVIGATEPELMGTLTSNYLDGFSLKSATSTKVQSH